MKLWPLFTIAGISLWSWLSGYYLSGEDKKGDDQVILKTEHTVNRIIWEKRKTMWELLDETTQSANKTELNLPTEKEALLQIIDKNINCKIRIQSTKWYRDFLSWTLTIEKARNNIMDALIIENEIEKNPTILIKLQTTELWRWYISGDVLPKNVVYSEIPAINFIEQFQKNNSKIFSKIEENPIFYKNEKWEETTFAERSNTIIATMKTEEFLQNNPIVSSKLSQYGYTMNDIYVGQSGNMNDIYWQMNALAILWNQTNFYPEVWQQFWLSEKWQLYTSNKITPWEALIYMNELMWKFSQ